MNCPYGICDECQRSAGCDYCDDFIPSLYKDDTDEEDI